MHCSCALAQTDVHYPCVVIIAALCLCDGGHNIAIPCIPLALTNLCRSYVTIDILRLSGRYATVVVPSQFSAIRVL